MRVLLIIAAGGCLLAPSLVQEAAPQQERKIPLMVSFIDLKWVELPERKGMQFAVLSGDPKTGAYTQIRKVSAGTDNPLHSHTSEITNVIIRGIWYTGSNSTSAKDFGPGSVITMPADWVHVSGCVAPEVSACSTSKVKESSPLSPMQRLLLANSKPTFASNQSLEPFAACLDG